MHRSTQRNSLIFFYLKIFIVFTVTTHHSANFATVPRLMISADYRAHLVDLHRHTSSIKLNILLWTCVSGHRDGAAQNGDRRFGKKEHKTFKPTRQSSAVSLLFIITFCNRVNCKFSNIDQFIHGCSAVRTRSVVLPFKCKDSTVRFLIVRYKSTPPGEPQRKTLFIFYKLN